MADAQNRAQRAYEAKMADAETDAKRLRSEAEAQIASAAGRWWLPGAERGGLLALLAAAKVAAAHGGRRPGAGDSSGGEVGEQA